MKKHLIALAVAAAVAAPAAMADTTLYGLANLSLDYIDNGVDSDMNVASGSSRLGVKGTEKLSGGLSAVYQMEFGVDMADSTTLGARNQFVGLTGGFGTLVMGRHDTPLKMTIGKYDLFGDQIGDNGNATTLSTKVQNLRAPNVVAYMLPKMGGFNGAVAYVADPTGDNSDNNDLQAYNIQLGYEHKMFSIDGAYQNVNVAVGDDIITYALGAGVKFGGFKVNALYLNENDAGADESVYGLGAAYTFGKNTVKGQYYAQDEADRAMFALGYDFAMSKQTTLFAAYASGEKALSVWGDGHGGKTSTHSGEDTSAFSVGIKHKF
ncbi:MAG: porin [Pseudomonadota bacterium]